MKEPRNSLIRNSALAIGLSALGCLTTLEAQTATPEVKVNPDHQVRILQPKNSLTGLLDAYDHVAFTQDVCTSYMLVLEKSGKATLMVAGMGGTTLYVGKFAVEQDTSISLTLERKDGHPEGRWPEGKWSKMTFKRQGDTCSLELPKKDPQNPWVDSLDLMTSDLPIIYSKDFLQDKERNPHSDSSSPSK